MVDLLNDAIQFYLRGNPTLFIRGNNRRPLLNRYNGSFLKHWPGKLALPHLICVVSSPLTCLTAKWCTACPYWTSLARKEMTGLSVLSEIIKNKSQRQTVQRVQSKMNETDCTGSSGILEPLQLALYNYLVSNANTTVHCKLIATQLVKWEPEIFLYWKDFKKLRNEEGLSTACKWNGGNVKKNTWRLLHSAGNPTL